MEALHATLLWVVMSGESLWAKFSKSKYFKGGVPSDNKLIFTYVGLCGASLSCAM